MHLDAKTKSKIITSSTQHSNSKKLNENDHIAFNTHYTNPNLYIYKNKNKNKNKNNNNRKLDEAFNESKRTNI